MSNTTHTPGPWFVADGTTFNDRMPRIATKGPSVAKARRVSAAPRREVGWRVEGTVPVNHASLRI